MIGNCFLDAARFMRNQDEMQSRPLALTDLQRIVAGADVRIAPTAVSHGSLFITVKNTLNVSQPEPFSKGETVVVPDQSTTVTEQDARVLVLEHAPTLGDLARALNSLKVSPRDIIAIFQALKDAGALHAELVIM